MLHCPWCHATSDGAESYEQGVEPEEGDVSICWSCRQISIYTHSLGLRIPNGEEYERAIKNPGVRRALYLTHEMPDIESAIVEWRSS